MDSPNTLSLVNGLPGPRALALVAALALGLNGSTGLAWTQGRGKSPEQETRAFQIYDTQAVQALVQDVEEHMAAERWAEGLAGLETLLNEHSGELLAGSRPPAPESGKPSLYAVHEGALEWATRTLLALPAEARDLYQERHGATARRALAQAIGRGDRRALTLVARRWPGTREAVSAWWALGDLEIERGGRVLGLQAWGRALGMALGTAPPTSPVEWEQAITGFEALGGSERGTQGARLRTDFALRFLSGSDDVGAPSTPPSVTALTPRLGSPDPGSAKDSWPSPHFLSTGPTHPFKQHSRGKFALYPARLDDTLFYSTTRSLHALEAFTGEELWSTPHGYLGWPSLSREVTADYEKALALRDGLVVPVATQGVVVAGFQIPRVFEKQDSFGDLEIIRIVPERRLFAFDAASGTPLWDHAPPPLWDGESGSFPHRMTVVGPVATSGSRLLVPSAMLRGRIELHLACYDLHSGELLWNTPLVTGQRPINMFGRVIEEFTAPPPVVVADRVVVQTQLGTMCCLDLFTGEVLWQSLYNQIPFTPGTYYSDGELRSVWRNAPPVVHDSTILATPFDSRHLLGFDLDSGAVLWEVSHVDLNNQAGVTYRTGVLDTLLGAQGEQVYLGGTKVAAFSSSRGLDREAPMNRVWLYPAAETLPRPTPRPVITTDHVFVPGLQDVATLDRRTGRIVDTIPTGSRPGNLLVGEGMLFTLSTFSLSAHFEWDQLLREARSRIHTAPADPRTRHALVRLLFKRGQAAMHAHEFPEASRFLADALEELQPLLGEDPTQTEPERLSVLHEILFTQARNLRLGADPLGALRALRTARPLAPTAARRCTTLLEEQAILRGRDLGDWLEVVSLLERDHADVRIGVFAPGVEKGESEWDGRLVVAATSLAAESEERAPLEVPVGLWVAVERGRALAQRGRSTDGAREFADLHKILRIYGEETLPSGSAWAWAADRIGAKLERGDRAGYESFETRARDLLDKGTEASDLAALERVPLLFPHSAAAELSNDRRIDAASIRGDVAEVADIVLSELPDRWSPKEASERELLHLLQLADTLGRGGNLELRAAWAASLAREKPNVRLAWDGAPPRPLKELLRGPAWSAPPRPPSPQTRATFDEKVTAVAQPSYKSGSTLRPVGHVPPGPRPKEVVEGGDDEVPEVIPETVVLYCDGPRLYAISNTSAPQSYWRHYFGRSGTRASDALPTEYWKAIAVSPGRVHAASIGHVTTLDRETGQIRWRWSSGSMGLVALDCVSGVVVVRENSFDERGRDLYRLIGLDAASGAKLWMFQFRRGEYHARPIFGDEHLVLLPSSSGTGLIFDLFTGRHRGQFHLSLSTSPTAEAAWIEGTRLILPNFMRGTRPTRNHVLIVDLDGEQQPRKVSFSGGPGGDRELLAVISYEGRHFLHLSPVVSGPRDLRHAGLYELNTSLGALANRPLVELADGDVLVGMGLRKRIVLETPYLFAMRPADSGRSRAKLRALHLPNGERWNTYLPPSLGRVSGSMPLPAVSASTVALAYKKLTGAPGSRGRRAALIFLDRRSGRILAERPLSADMWRTTESGLHLSVLDGALIVSGALKMEFMR